MASPPLHSGENRSQREKKKKKRAERIEKIYKENNNMEERKEKGRQEEGKKNIHHRNREIHKFTSPPPAIGPSQRCAERK